MRTEVTRTDRRPPAAYTDEVKAALRTLSALIKAHHQVTAACTADIESHGLKLSEFEALEHLYRHGQAKQKEISEGVLLTSGSTTHVIDQLIKKGLVERVSDPDDRRCIYAKLTPQGKVLMDEIFPQHAQEIIRVLSGLSPAEQASAVRLLVKLESTAKAAGSPKNGIRKQFEAKPRR